MDPPDVKDPTVMDPPAMQASAGTEASESSLARLTRRTHAPSPEHGDGSLVHVASIVQRSSTAHATRPFTVTRTNHVVTYAGMYGRVNRIADVLLELGVDAGDSVGIFMPNCATVRASSVWESLRVRDVHEYGVVGTGVLWDVSTLCAVVPPPGLNGVVGTGVLWDVSTLCAVVPPPGIYGVI
jgi:hypothetical protein